MRLWDRQGNTIGKSLEGDQDHDVVTSSGGQIDRERNADGSVHLRDRQGNLIGPIKGMGHSESFLRVAISPDEQIIVSASKSFGNQIATIELWDRQGNPIGKPIEIELEKLQGSIDVDFSSDGQTIISRSSRNDTTKLLPVKLAEEGGWIGYTCRRLQGYLSVRRKIDDVAREAWHACKSSGVWKKDQSKEE